jgi:carbon-monoxide dehydrogenase medium subunit
MTPQSFEYVVANTVPAAITVLDEYGDSAQVLAGGQSLVPMMHLRLARPEVVVDINRLPGLRYVSVAGDEMRLGALVRHRDLERPGVDDPLGRLLATVAGHVGHLPIRVRGTVAGSLAHADPAAEWCLVAVAVGARLVLASSAGERLVEADDFFDYPFVTALRPGELITEVRLPLLGPRTGIGFREHAPTSGAFAQAAACALVTFEGRRAVSATIAVGGVGGRPVTLPAAAEPIVGGPLTGAVLDEVRARVREAVDPADDAVVPAAYRRAVTAELVAASLTDAAKDAGVTWN